MKIKHTMVFVHMSIFSNSGYINGPIFDIIDFYEVCFHPFTATDHKSCFSLSFVKVEN